MNQPNQPYQLPVNPYSNIQAAAPQQQGQNPMASKPNPGGVLGGIRAMAQGILGKPEAQQAQQAQQGQPQGQPQPMQGQPQPQPVQPQQKIGNWLLRNAMDKSANAGQWIGNLIEKHPNVAAGLFGGAVGSGVGAFYAEPEERVSGALSGGALGAGLGTLGGMGLNAMRSAVEKLTPSQRNVIIAGGVGGGLLGGLKGKSLVPQWIKQKERRHHVEERNKMAEEKKEPVAEKQAADQEKQFMAFDFGMSAFLAENDISKEAMAQELNVKPDELSAAVLSWLMAQK